MSADRGAYIDQSQSLNIHMTDANSAKVSSMHFYGWKKGLKTGMRLEEAKRRMDDRTRTGSSGYFINIVLDNPHRSMTFYGRKGERIEILLYLTDVRKLDGAFTPEQFTPVYFINDRLFGRGWDSLQLLKEEKRLGEDCQSKLLDAPRISKKLPGV